MCTLKTTKCAIDTNIASQAKTTLIWYDFMVGWLPNNGKEFEFNTQPAMLPSYHKNVL